MHGKKEDLRQQANIPQAKVTERSLTNNQEAAETPEIELLVGRALRKIPKPEYPGASPHRKSHKRPYKTSSSSSVR